MNKTWFKQQIFDKLIFGVMASLIAVLVFFNFNRINDKVTHVQKSSDIEVKFFQDIFDKFSDNIVKTISLLTLHQREMLTLTRDKSELREPMLRYGTNIEVLQKLFPESSEVHKHMSDCVELFSSKLSYINLPALRGNKLDTAIEELKDCHRRSVNALVPYFSDLIDKNYQKSSDRNKYKIFGMSVDVALSGIVFLLVLLIAVVGLVYRNAPTK